MSRERRNTPRIDIEDHLPGSITVVEPTRVAQISTAERRSIRPRRFPSERCTIFA